MTLAPDPPDAPTPSTVPAEAFVQSNGLDLHVLTWNDGGAETVLLAHGFLDTAWSYSAFAERLTAAGYRVVAWDWRGHGQSEWIGKGGYYHFPDYVLDLEGLFPQVVRGERAHLIGHSMGGTVSTMFAGVRSDRLHTLTLVEGLGPPAYPYEKTPRKMRSWLDSIAKIRQRPPRPLADHQEALRRMRLQNPDLPDELGLFLADKSTHVVDGQLVWRFDPLHRTTAPMPFREEVFGSFLDRIRVPSLIVAGEKGFRLPDEIELARYGRIRDHRFVEIPGVGHMVHWFEPDALADAWLDFVRSV